MKETIYIAVDFGLKRIGVAASDISKTLAFARGYFPNDEKVFVSILDLVKAENAEKIIIGYPLKFNSTHTHATIPVEKFSKKLNQIFKQNSLSVEIVFMDERLTSKLAQYHVANSEMRLSKRKNKGILDSLSAQIILQDYLDRLNNSNN